MENYLLNFVGILGFEIEFDFLAYYDESANERPEMPGLPEEKEEQEDEDIEVEPEEDEESAFEEKDDK